jgi:hypothetical protein
MESVVVHEEVPKEEAAVEMIRALKDWPVDWHPAVRCRSKSKKWTQGNGVSWKKLAAACRGMTHRAEVARHK